MEFLDKALGVHHTDLVDKQLHMDPSDSSSYRGMSIQGNAAEFAGTTDSIAAAAAAAAAVAAVAAAAWPQSQSLLVETDWPLLWSGWLGHSLLSSDSC